MHAVSRPSPLRFGSVNARHGSVWTVFPLREVPAQNDVEGDRHRGSDAPEPKNATAGPFLLRGFRSSRGIERRKVLRAEANRPLIDEATHAVFRRCERSVNDR